MCYTREMETPRFEETSEQDLEKEHSLRAEKIEQADKEVAGEVANLLANVERESATRTSFELDGRTVEIMNDLDHMVAKKLAVLKVFTTLAEQKGLANDHYGEKVATKLRERARVDLDLTLRDGELEREFPNTAVQITRAA